MAYQMYEMSSSFIELRNVYKSFGTQEVLKNITLNVNPHEIVGLIGPSGAGKSTIIKVALGMEKADKGSAEVFDTKMPNRKLLKDIGYMAQTDALYEGLTAKENLKFYARMKDLRDDLDAQIVKVAEIVDLSDSLNKRVENFSGGMQRRLSLAIALLGKPDLLVLDEPTVGIDPALRKKIWAELSRLRNDGCGILITTHVMDEAELCDRVILFNGEVIANDTPANLETNYQVNSIEEVFLKAEGE
jgi:ABC-2 type transport system ATP-binding protein